MEKTLHTAFAPNRVNHKREFFSINAQQAIAILKLLHVDDATQEIEAMANADLQEDIDWLVTKITQLRIFGDENGVMNLSVEEVNGDVLVVSQFTLHADAQKGNRPSYIKAARPEIAIPLYEQFIKQMEFDLGKSIQTGKFGADMKVSLMNDGPVTILLDSKKDLNA